MDTRPIGVFDSGLGGLTAVRQLRRVLPGEDIIYFGDTGRVPYGSRGREIIRQYARQDIRFLLSHDVKFIIAACGTVSSTYPPEEAARLPVPFTGVVGATARAAVDATRNGKVGIIGTAATVRSGSYAAVIKDMKPETEIVARACPMFVPLVENGYVNDGNPVTKLIIAEYLQEVKDAGVDTLILGCTHYPLLKKMIGDFMGSDVTLIAAGIMVSEALAAAEQLAVEGISARVIDMFTIKPIDAEIIKLAAAETGAIVTCENHSVINGLGSAVAEVLVQNTPVPMEMVGVKDEFGEVGDEAYLKERFGLWSDSSGFSSEPYP